MNIQEPRLIAKKPASMRGRLIWIGAILVVAGAVAWVVYNSQHQANIANGGRPGAPAAGAGRGGRFVPTGPIPVVAAPVTKGDLEISLDGLGTVTPLATVMIKTQIAGQLQTIAFQEGQMVKKGDFLVQIDPRPYQAILDQDQGQLLKDEALLKQAQLDLVRYHTLLAEDSIASQTVDTQESLVQQYVGTVATDRADVDAAKLNVAYCHIVAPVAGRVGLRQVDLGNYIQPSDANPIVVITQMQPMSVLFTLPEDQLPAVLTSMTKGQQLRVRAYDRAKTRILATGRLDTVDNVIDPTTGTVKLRALFDNDPEILFPQQFVNIELLVETMKNTTNVPSAGVQNGAPGAYVYLVKDDNTVAVRPVKTGPQSGDRVAIVSGLEVGDKIVVDGTDKLRDGTAISLPTATDGTGAKADGAAPAGQEREHRRRDKEAGASNNKTPQ